MGKEWVITVLVSILILGIFVTAIPTALATHPVTTIVLPAGTPRDIDIDPSLNKIYVSLESTGVLAIIDGGTNAVTTVAIGAPLATINDGEMTVNTVTHRVYMADTFPSSFIVVDGSTETRLADITGVTPGCVVSPAANSITNIIYGSTQCSDSIVAMDGSTGAKITAVRLGGVGSLNAVNPSNNLIYNALTPQFSPRIIATRVYDGSALPSLPLITTIPAFATTINPVTNLVYSSSGAEPILVFDGNVPAHPQVASIALGTANSGMGVNPITNTLYVSLGALDQVAIIDLNTNLEIDRVDVPDAPGRIAVNPDTGKVYVLHIAGKIVSVFDDSVAPPAAITCGADTELLDSVCVVTQALRDQITGLQVDLAAAQDDLAQAEADRDQALADLAAAQDDLAQAEADRDQALADLADALNDIVTLEGDLAQALQDLRNAVADLVAAQATIAARDATITGLETDLATAQATIAARDATITGLETDLATAQNTISELEAEVEELGLPGAPVANQGGGQGVPAQGKNNKP